ncbi:hypothetical protein DD829_06440 [Chryseobacterium sp. HMWF035]|nr:hypothetical protein DBR25_00065 [Chryseobacterium sp. HMWF001]PVV59068.1 hypothetical protein DD829_06440 [Chryseobacterium sp. HMWF035]
MSSGFHCTKFLTKILNIIFMNVKPYLRSECDQAFIRFLKLFFEVFNDKIKGIPSKAVKIITFWLK